MGSLEFLRDPGVQLSENPLGKVVASFDRRFEAAPIPVQGDQIVVLAAELELNAALAARHPAAIRGNAFQQVSKQGRIAVHQALVDQHLIELPQVQRVCRFEVGIGMLVFQQRHHFVLDPANSLVFAPCRLGTFGTQEGGHQQTVGHDSGLCHLIENADDLLAVDLARLVFANQASHLMCQIIRVQAIVDLGVDQDL